MYPVSRATKLFDEELEFVSWLHCIYRHYANGRPGTRDVLFTPPAFSRIERPLWVTFDVPRARRTGPVNPNDQTCGAYSGTSELRSKCEELALGICCPLIPR